MKNSFFQKIWEGAGMCPPSSEYVSVEYVQLLLDTGAIKRPCDLKKYLVALKRIGESPYSPGYLQDLKEMGISHLTIGEMQLWKEIREMPRTPLQAVYAKRC